MSALVSLAQAAAYLGLQDDEPPDDVLRALVDQVEALFNADCGRIDHPFQAKQSARTEVYDGTGGRVLYVDYPIAALTSITLGYDVTDPAETLAVTDPVAVKWAVGSRRIVRNDFGLFGRGQAPRYVTVVYDAQADLPVNAEVAILRGVAALHLQRGAEDVKEEWVGAYRGYLGAALDDDPIWRRAVEANRAVIV